MSNATYHYYYDGQQMVETRNGSDLTIKQNVWGLTYIDELVQTSLNDDPTSLTEQLCESNFYALQDANYNVLGILDEVGILTERYEYTPYGARQVYTSAGPNDPACMTPTLQSQRQNLYIWTPGTSGEWIAIPLPQPYGLNDVGHQGLFHDEEVGLICNRARELHPKLSRFMQRDPLNQNQPGGGYQDGMGLYQYVRSNPVTSIDPLGEAVPIIPIVTIGNAAINFGVGCYLGLECARCVYDNADLTRNLLNALANDPVKLQKFIQGQQQNPPCTDICKAAGKRIVWSVIWIGTSGASHILKIKISIQ